MKLRALASTPLLPGSIVALGLLAGAPGVGAQIISPGKLSEAHAELEGMRRCTACHELRKPGAARGLCLECHAPVKARLEEDRGFHASLAEGDCAACHKEHLGRDFDLLRLDSLVFEHDRTGYVLEGRHAEISCGECHRPEWVVAPDVLAFREEHGAGERTFLGLPARCGGCHGPDDPHDGQFPGRGCDACHGQEEWEGAETFDHDRARYPLTGGHVGVSCELCHGAADVSGRGVRYRPLEFGACASCHEDPHGGAMAGACRDCHTTLGWARVDPAGVEGRFDHGSTGFRLEGRHGAIACGLCHDPGLEAEGIRRSFPAGSGGAAFPPPEASSCRSCHLEAHEEVVAQDAEGGSTGECSACHGQDAWLPADYDLARHEALADFPLTGAHMAVPCESCHRDPPEAGGALSLRLGPTECVSCHEEADPHGDQFRGRSCDACHSVTSFRIPDFDHGVTGFPLEGEHRDAACRACHGLLVGADGVERVRYRPLDTACRSCHGGRG